MNYGGQIIPIMSSMIAFFQNHCADTKTLIELHNMIADKSRWPKAHALFDRIRKDRIKANNKGDKLLDSQYKFEEICAKTIFNLSGESAPFDPDSPFWVVPNAMALANDLGIKQEEILDMLRIKT